MKILLKLRLRNSKSLPYLAFRVMMISFFIVGYYYALRISESSTIARAITNIIETRPINLNSDTYKDITLKSHIAEFMSNVLITQIYRESVKEYPPLIDGYHYVRNFNYFMGMRVTHNRIDLKEYKGVHQTGFEYVRKINYVKKPNMQYSNLNTTTFGTSHPTKYCSDCGYAGKGGFVQYFESNWTYTEALNYFNDLRDDGMLDDQALSIVLEIMFYNENYQTGVTLIYQFFANNWGNIERYKDVQSFYVSKYKSKFRDDRKVLVFFLFVFDILFIIEVLMLSFKCFLIVRTRIIEIIRIKIYTVRWHEYVDVSITVFSYVWIAYWIIIFCAQIDIELPVQGVDSFQKYITLQRQIHEFIIFASVLTVLICMRCIRLITEKFPSFGALFQTIKLALKDVGVFMLATLIIMLGFMYALYFVVGPYDSSFNDPILCFIKLLYLTFGHNVSIETKDHNWISDYSKLFFVVFLIVFYFLIAKMMITIVMIRYLYLRSVVQLDNTVRARIVSHESKKIRNKWRNLILWRVNGKSKNLKGIKNKKGKFSLWRIFRMNLSKILAKKKLKTNEFLKKEHRQTKRKILKERELEKQRRKYKYSDKNLHEHKHTIYKLLLYMCYTIIFFVVLVYQLKTSESFEAHYIKEIIQNIKFDLSDNFYSDTHSQNPRKLQEDPKDDPPQDESNDGSEPKQSIILTFDDINETPFIDQWVSNVFLPLLYNNTKRVIYNQNYWVGDPMIYLGVRKTKLYDNKDRLTKEIFPQYISQNAITIHDSLGNEAVTDTIQLSDGTFLKYTKESSGNSYADIGGYILGYSRNRTKAFSSDYFKEENLITDNWVNIYLGFLYINRNIENFVLNIVHFQNIPSGEIVAKYEVYSIRDFYKTSGDYVRLLFEIVIVIINAYFLYLLLKSLAKIYLKLWIDYFNRQSHALKANKLWCRIIGFDIISSQNKECLPTLWYFMYKVCVSVVRYSFMIVQSVYRCIKKDFMVIVNILNVALTLAMIDLWIKIATQDLFVVSEDGQSKEAYEYAWATVEYLDVYKKISSVNVLLLFSNMSFTFSSKLAMFYDIIRKASADIALFLLMLFILLLSFSLIGHINFGVTDDDFKSLPDATLNMFITALGQFTSFDVDTYYQWIAHCHGIAFLMFDIMLLYMLIAIIASYYFEHYIEQENVNSNIFRLILRSLLNKDKAFEGENSNYFKKLYYKARHKMRNWAFEIVEEKECPFKVRFKPQNADILQKNIMISAPEHVISRLVSPPSMDDLHRLNSNTEANKSKFHFWVAALDKFAGDNNYFQRLQDDRNNLFLHEPGYSWNAQDISLSKDQSTVVDDDIILFWMSTQDKQIDAWNAADVDTKMLYWNILQENLNVLETKRTHKRRVSLSMYDHNYEVNNSYDMSAIEKLHSSEEFGK